MGETTTSRIPKSQGKWGAGRKPYGTGRIPAGG